MFQLPEYKTWVKQKIHRILKKFAFKNNSNFLNSRFNPEKLSIKKSKRSYKNPKIFQNLSKKSTFLKYNFKNRLSDI